MIKKLSAALVVCLLGSLSAAAKEHPGVVVSKDGLKVRALRSIPGTLSSPLHDPSLTVIYNNLSTAFPHSLYFCCLGYAISGPASDLVENVQFAVQFVPNVTAMATEIDLAYTYYSGTHTGAFALYSDAGGRPGALLKLFHFTDYPPFGSCCQLAVLKDKQGIPIVSGTPYWLAGIVDDTNQDQWGVWEENTSNEIDQIYSAVNYGGGWQPVGGQRPAPGFAIYGH